MTSYGLVLRGLRYYWRTNAAVVLGVATAVAVLTGALLVGDSVRGSLRDLVLLRLGAVDRAVISSGFFRDSLAGDLQQDASFTASFEGICPLIMIRGLVTDQAGGRHAPGVQVYGVDDRFWRFHRVTGPLGRGPDERDALISRVLASELGADPGATLLVRVERPSAIPIESLHGRKDNLGRTLRLRVHAILPAADLGDFSLQPRQGDVRAVFVPLRRLQQDLDVSGRVNTLLVSDRREEGEGRREGRRDGRREGGPERRREGSREEAGEQGREGRQATLEALIRRRFALEDVGLTIRNGASGALVVESAAGLLDDARAKAAEEAATASAMRSQGVFTYLANAMTSGGHQVPYSLVTAIDLRTVAPDAPDAPYAPYAMPAGGPSVSPNASPGVAPAVPPIVLTGPAPALPPIVLNDWAARDLGARIGDPLTLEYYVWEDPGRLLTRTADFRIAGVVPIAGVAADRNLTPVYPGITEARNLGSWDPPFPIDLRRVRRIDEDYWDAYRTTPKAFIPLEVGERLWRSRFGARTSIRVAGESGSPSNDATYAARLRASIDPLALGLAVRDVRGDNLAASRGATDFGEYFAYFSIFLVVSAVMLAALFFRLGIEQRARSVGLLRAVGFTTARVRRLFSGEGFVLAVIGSLVGAAGAVAYGAAMMAGLRTWWSGAVGTTALTLHVSPLSLAAGASGALVTAMACIWWTLRGLSRLSERRLLAGQVAPEPRPVRSPVRVTPSTVAAVVFGAAGLALAAASFVARLDRTGAFFGAGSSLLIAGLCVAAVRLRRPPRSPLEGHGWRPIWRLGLRHAADRPSRSVLAIGVIASATFLLIAVEAFRQEGPPPTDRHSGVGGYPLLADLLLPVVNDPNLRDGREMLGLSAEDPITIEPFRVLQGDDASCLNLYEPRNPRILGVSRAFIESGRFAFQSSLASNAAERANPWLLLGRDAGADAVPVIADANSMTYVLHKQLGDDLVITRGDRRVRLRLVAALADSIFQSELLMSDANFSRLFPEQEGYRFLLIDAPSDRVAQVKRTISESAADLGADVVETTARLAGFHTVENTYLSTFQLLGGLGLLVGTIGLAAVLLRNVLERRSELALLGAVGYRRRHIVAIVVAENLLLLAWGLALGTACAVVAIAPALSDRGRWPATSGGGLLLVAVFAAGLVSSIVATHAALRTRVVDALRSEG